MTEETHGRRHQGEQRHGSPGGVTVSANGLTVDPSETRLEPETDVPWSFRIYDAEGTVVTDFEATHGERSHLVIVRRDLTHFQHLHPELDSDGTWTTQVTLPAPGAYRAFVDVAVGDETTTLGTDLLAPGATDVAPSPGSSRAIVVDDYEITLGPDEITVGESTTLEFELRREGEPVSQLEPYLGALGHLVALREGDLAYVHVHPIDGDRRDGTIAFDATFPTPGTYRLFLQARPRGELVTGAFDVTLPFEA